MLSRRFFVTVLFLCVSVARADPAPEEVSASAAFQSVCDALRSVRLVEADFSEEKTIHLLSHPLHSTGTLLFSPQQGVYRVMKEPMQQELLITRSELVQKDSQGKVQRMTVRQQPAAQAFVTVFLSFFSGDESAWRKSFNVSFSGTLDAWRIEFSPLPKSPVAKAIRHMVLEGRQSFLDAMTLTESSGDITRTVYTNHRVSGRFPADLSVP